MLMILKKKKAKEYKGKPIYVWEIVIPPKDIKELGWYKGMELEGIVVKDKGYFISPKE